MVKSEKLTLLEWKEKFDYHFEWFKHLLEFVDNLTIDSKASLTELEFLSSNIQLYNDKDLLVENPKFELSKEECEVYYNYTLLELDKIIYKLEHRRFWINSYKTDGLNIKHDEFVTNNTKELVNGFSKFKKTNLPFNLIVENSLIIENLFDSSLTILRRFLNSFQISIHGIDYKQKNKFSKLDDVEVFRECINILSFENLIWHGKTDKDIKNPIKDICREANIRARNLQLLGNLTFVGNFISEVMVIIENINLKIEKEIKFRGFEVLKELMFYQIWVYALEEAKNLLVELKLYQKVKPEESENKIVDINKQMLSFQLENNSKSIHVNVGKIYEILKTKIIFIEVDKIAFCNLFKGKNIDEIKKTEWKKSLASLKYFIANIKLVNNNAEKYRICEHCFTHNYENIKASQIENAKQVSAKDKKRIDEIINLYPLQK